LQDMARISLLLLMRQRKAELKTGELQLKYTTSNTQNKEKKDEKKSYNSNNISDMYY